MRAEYESEVDTLAIDLAVAKCADHGDDTIAGAIVHVRDDRPVAIDLLDVRAGIDEALAAIATTYALDLESLQAAARAALAAPDRIVELDVHARVVA